MMKTMPLIVVILLVAGGFLFLMLSSEKEKPATPREGVELEVKEALKPEVDDPGSASAAMEKPEQVRILDRLDSTPIEGAIVHCSYTNSDVEERLVSTSSGGITPSTAGSVTLDIEAAGYAPLSVDLDLLHRPQVVHLDRLGSITVQFVDGFDQPVAGIPAALLPPILGAGAWGQEWRFKLRDTLARLKEAKTEVDTQQALRGGDLPQEVQGRILELIAQRRSQMGVELVSRFDESCAPSSWIQLSDEKGLVRWRGLLPGHSYHWGCFNEFIALDLSPAAEVTVLSSNSAGHIEVDAIPHRGGDFSGRMELEVGDHLRFKAVVHVNSGITGRIEVPPGGWEGNALKEFNIDFSRGIRHAWLEQLTIPDETGEFAFGGLLPGEKEIRGYARDAKNTYFFFLHSVVVESGVTVDVGTLKALHGERVKAKVEFQTSSGERVDPSLVGPLYRRDALSFEPSERTDETVVSVIFSNGPPGGTSKDGISERWMVAIEEPFEITGLQRGRSSFLLEMDGYQDPSSDVRIRAQRDIINLTLPAEDLVILPIFVDFLKTQRIKVHYPDELFRCDVDFVSETTGKTIKNIFSTRGGDRFFEGEVKLPVDDYRVIVTPRSESSTANYAVMASIGSDRIGADLLELTLEPAATLAGVVHFDEDPKIHAVFFKYLWGADQKSGNFYSRFDKDGLFTMNGLIPGSTVQEVRSGQIFEVPGSGQTLQVTVSW